MSDARDYEDAYLRNDGDYKQQRCPHGWVDIKQCRDCDNIKEIESLRQQLAVVTSHRDGLNHLCEFNERAMGRLQQQLSDSQKREVMLRDAILYVYEHYGKSSFDWHYTEKALAATADLSGVILCHAAPDSYRYKHHDSFGVGFFWSHRPTHQGSDALESAPLYRAWEPKP